MRCSCILCGTYMVHSQRGESRCICPECGNTCDICMGNRNGERIEKIDGKIKIPDLIKDIYDKEEN